MSYYELVSILDEMISSPSIDELIAKINNANISLKDMRYERFISQVEYTLNHRLKGFIDRLIDKISIETISDEAFILELSLLNTEISNLKKIVSLNIIKDENKAIFLKSIIKNNNELLDKLKTFVADENKLIEINNHYLKEEN